MAQWKRLMLFVAILLPACTQEPVPTLKVGVNQWAGYEPLFLAQHLQHYPEDAIKLVELPSNTESIQLLRQGRLDAAALTLDEAIVAANTGIPLSVLAVFDFSRGADVLLAGDGVPKLIDLKGHKVGVESTGVGAILLHAALQQAGLHAQDIQPVYLTADEHVQALQRGKVDALVTFEPAKSKLLAQGAHVLFDSSAVPDLIVDVLVVRTDTLQQQYHHLHALLQGYYRALAYMRQQPKQAMRIMAPRLQTTPALLAQAYQGLYIPSWQEGKAYLAKLPTHAHAMCQVMQYLGKVLQCDTLALSPDTRWLEAVE